MGTTDTALMNLAHKDTERTLDPDALQHETTLNALVRHRTGWSRKQNDTKRHEYDTRPSGAGHNTTLNDTTTTQNDTKGHECDSEPVGAGHKTTLNDTNRTQNGLEPDTQRH